MMMSAHALLLSVRDDDVVEVRSYSNPFSFLFPNLYSIFVYRLDFINVRNEF